MSGRFYYISSFWFQFQRQQLKRRLVDLRGRGLDFFKTFNEYKGQRGTTSYTISSKLPYNSASHKKKKIEDDSKKLVLKKDITKQNEGNLTNIMIKSLSFSLMS
jgi:hypothetical protein